MKLVSISVANFRSITKAPKIRIGRSTTLVGPNNEGKSNILFALTTAMKVLTDPRMALFRDDRRIPLRILETWYSWERDYPIHLQAKNENGESIITVEFELSKDEITAFKKEIRSSLNGTLPIKIILGRNRAPKVVVAKPGKGNAALSRKSAQIADFVSSRLDFEYIPAVRTAMSSEEIVRGLIERELQTLDDDPAFQEALAKVTALQDPILKQLSESIKGTLVKFLPDVKGVDVTIRSSDRTRALRANCEIFVDDGRRTSLGSPNRCVAEFIGREDGMRLLTYRGTPLRSELPRCESRKRGD
ncbi:MAG: AAA family ATPase, partial [Thermoanaerobaculia bacterium]